MDVSVRPFGIAIASTYLMYLPALFVSGPLWLYAFLKNIKFFWKEKKLTQKIQKMI